MQLIKENLKLSMFVASSRKTLEENVLNSFDKIIELKARGS
jgi:hypothetical protein